MKEFFSGLINGYNSLLGTSKIVPAAWLAIAAVILLYNDTDDLERRRIHPAVFLLSVYSCISYVIVLCRRKSKSVFVFLFSFAVICMTGDFIFYDNSLKRSIYKNGEYYEIIFSIIAIIFYLLTHLLIACRLFDESNYDTGRKKEIMSDRAVFVISVVMLGLFGFYSEKLALASMFLSPLSLSSIMLYGILPLLLWLYLVYEDKIKIFTDKYFAYEEENGGIEGTEDYEEEWDMKKHKILNMRNMAVAVVVIVICFAGAVLVLNSKINSLYDATVLLTDAANDKASIYEVRSGDKICASITVSSDGSITVTGGGDSADGRVLYDELAKISTTVSKWYLYGEDDKNKGAYDYCRENGITVLNAYVLSDIKEIE